MLDRGRAIYFGPTKKAKQYFIDLGFDCEARKTTPDFLTGISNPQERRVREGFEGKVPENSAELEEAFVNSQAYADSLQELKEYEDTIKQEVNFLLFIKLISFINVIIRVPMKTLRQQCSIQRQRGQERIQFILPVCGNNFMPLWFVRPWCSWVIVLASSLVTSLLLFWYVSFYLLHSRYSLLEHV